MEYFGLMKNTQNIGLGTPLFHPSFERKIHPPENDRSILPTIN